MTATHPSDPSLAEELRTWVAGSPIWWFAGANAVLSVVLPVFGNDERAGFSIIAVPALMIVEVVSAAVRVQRGRPLASNAARRR